MSKDNPTPEEELIQVLSALVIAQSHELEQALDVKDNYITVTSRAIMHKARKKYLADKGIVEEDDENATDWMIIPIELSKTFRRAMKGLQEVFGTSTIQ